MKQIALPTSQRHSRWLPPVLVVVALLCVTGVVVILLSDVTGPFAGPWG